MSSSRSPRSKFSSAQIRAAELLAGRAGITRSLTAVGSDREDFIELHVDQLVALLTQDLDATTVEVAECLADYGFEDVRPVAEDLVFVVDKDLGSWAGQAARVCRKAILSKFGDCGSAWQVRSRSPWPASSTWKPARRSVLATAPDAEVEALLKRAPYSLPADRRILVCWKTGGAA